MGTSGSHICEMSRTLRIVGWSVYRGSDRWRPEKVSLVRGSPMGNATESTQAMLDDEGKLGLTYVDFLSRPSCIETDDPILLGQFESGSDRPLQLGMGRGT